MSFTNNCINKIKQHDNILNLKCYTEFLCRFHIWFWNLLCHVFMSNIYRYFQSTFKQEKNKDAEDIIIMVS